MTREDIEVVDQRWVPRGKTSEWRRHDIRTSDLLVAMRHVHGHDAVVHAGGGVGAWSRWLAQRFDRVYVFEPDLTNYACLSRNISCPNVYPIAARLDAALATENLGTKLDAYGVNKCNLLILSMRQGSAKALYGSEATLCAWAPTVMLRDATSVIERDDARRFLATNGYDPVDDTRDYVIYAKR